MSSVRGMLNRIILTRGVVLNPVIVDEATASAETTTAAAAAAHEEGNQGRPRRKKFCLWGCFHRVCSSIKGDATAVTHPEEVHVADEDDHTHRSRLMEEMLGIRRYLFEKLHLTNFGRDESVARHLPKVLDTVDFAGVMKHWNEGKFKKIITMVGAGISTCKFCFFTFHHQKLH